MAVLPALSSPTITSVTFLTGSRHRLNKLQQLAIRLNIPGLSSRHLPSEPREGMGPELPGPAQGPPSPQAPLRWTGQRAGPEGGDRDGSLGPVPNRVRPPPRDSPNPGSGTPERRWWDSRENPRVDVLTFRSSEDPPSEPPTTRFSNQRLKTYVRGF